METRTGTPAAESSSPQLRSADGPSKLSSLPRQGRPTSPFAAPVDAPLAPTDLGTLAGGMAQRPDMPAPPPDARSLTRSLTSLVEPLTVLFGFVRDIGLLGIVPPGTRKRIAIPEQGRFAPTTLLKTYREGMDVPALILDPADSKTESIHARKIKDIERGISTLTTTNAFIELTYRSIHDSRERFSKEVKACDTIENANQKATALQEIELRKRTSYAASATALRSRSSDLIAQIKRLKDFPDIPPVPPATQSGREEFKSLLRACSSSLIQGLGEIAAIESYLIEKLENQFVRVHKGAWPESYAERLLTELPVARQDAWKRVASLTEALEIISIEGRHNPQIMDLTHVLHGVLINSATASIPDVMTTSFSAQSEAVNASYLQAAESAMTIPKVPGDNEDWMYQFLVEWDAVRSQCSTLRAATTIAGTRKNQALLNRYANAFTGLDTTVAALEDSLDNSLAAESTLPSEAEAIVRDLRLEIAFMRASLVSSGDAARAMGGKPFRRTVMPVDHRIPASQITAATESTSAVESWEEAAMGEDGTSDVDGTESTAPTIEVRHLPTKRRVDEQLGAIHALIAEARVQLERHWANWLGITGGRIHLVSAEMNAGEAFDQASSLQRELGPALKKFPALGDRVDAALRKARLTHDLIEAHSSSPFSVRPTQAKFEEWDDKGWIEYVMHAPPDRGGLKTLDSGEQLVEYFLKLPPIEVKGKFYARLPLVAHGHLADGGVDFPGVDELEPKHLVQPIPEIPRTRDAISMKPRAFRMKSRVGDSKAPRLPVDGTFFVRGWHRASKADTSAVASSGPLSKSHPEPSTVVPVT